MMTRSIMQQAAGMLGCLLLAFSANSQTFYWGVGSATGVSDAEFQNNFVQASSFTAGDNPTAWTALTISDDGGNNTPGAAYWVRSITGVSQGAYSGNMTAVPSPSQANGVALFDSDFLDNGGTRLPAGAGTGTAPANQRGELISPRIDLTTARNTAVLLEFFCQYRPFRVTEWSVSISIDDGQSWTNTTDVRSLLAGVTNATSSGTVRWSLPNFTNTTGNLSECRVKFTFEGQYYYFTLDDLSIQSTPEFDIAIGEVDPNANTYFSVGNEVRMGGGNAFIPLSHILGVAPANDETVNWAWGAKVINRGYGDLLSNSGARLICQVDHVDLNTAAITTGVFYDTIAMDPTDTLKANNFDGVPFVKELTNLDFIKNLPNSAGEYRVTYWAEHNGMDGSSDNDTIRHSFVVSEAPAIAVGGGRTGSYYYSKAGVGSDGRPFRGGSIFPGNGPHSLFEYGSIYYFPEGETDSVVIDSVDFRYYLRNAFSGATNQTVYVNIYEFVDGSNGGAANGFIAGDELTQIGIGSISLTGLGTTNAAGSYHLGTSRTIINASTAQPLKSGDLKDGAFYYVSVQINPSASGGIATFGANDVPIHAVHRLNYAMNIGLTTTAKPYGPSTMQVVDAAGSASWFAGFNGFDEVPSIGLYISSYSQPLSTPRLPQQDGVELTIFPNPVSDQLSIKWSREGQPTNVQYVITDATGRVVYWHTSNNVNQEVHQMDASQLTPGVYFVSARAAEGVTTQRFVKQ